MPVRRHGEGDPPTKVQYAPVGCLGPAWTGTPRPRGTRIRPSRWGGHMANRTLGRRCRQPRNDPFWTIILTTTMAAFPGTPRSPPPRAGQIQPGFRQRRRGRRQVRREGRGGGHPRPPPRRVQLPQAPVEAPAAVANAVLGVPLYPVPANILWKIGVEES